LHTTDLSIQLATRLSGHVLDILLGVVQVLLRVINHVPHKLRIVVIRRHCGNPVHVLTRNAQAGANPVYALAMAASEIDRTDRRGTRANNPAEPVADHSPWQRANPAAESSHASANKRARSRPDSSRR
jgi:hypothetical protein